jgi:dTDP-glucose 4,6-dehydratase
MNSEELEQMVTRLGGVWDDLRGATMLITGATGWFGVWLLDALCMADETLALGLSITAVSREPERFLQRFPRFLAEPRIKWIKADLRNRAPRGHFSHVIHAAADNSIESGPDALRVLFDTIVDGARNVLDASGPHCGSLLLVSSGAVYGPAREDQTRFLESDAGGPDPSLLKHSYAEGKRAAEQLGAMAVAKGVPVRIARCFAFVGPHMPFNRHFAIGNFIADAVAGRPIRIKSDGRATRSYLYMTDLIAALLIILCRGTVGRAYNVGSDVSSSIEDLAHAVDRVVSGCGVVVEGATSDPTDRYVPDTTRLRQELGFAPVIALDEAIARTAAWYRSRVHE